MRAGELTTVPLAGEITQGRPIDTTAAGEPVVVPRDHLDDRDVVYRAARDLRGHGIECGDLLIVESRPAGNAVTAELVLAMLGDAAWIGRWWAKFGQRALMNDRMELLSDDEALRVVGAITVIVRHSGC